MRCIDISVGLPMKKSAPSAGLFVEDLLQAKGVGNASGSRAIDNRTQRISMIAGTRV